MDAVTWDACKASIRTINEKMLGTPFNNKPLANESINALANAVEALTEWQNSAPRLNLTRHINVLAYHVEKPGALLFKDRYTIAALEAGVQALEHKLGMRTIFQED